MLAVKKAHYKGVEKTKEYNTQLNAALETKPGSDETQIAFKPWLQLPRSDATANAIHRQFHAYIQAREDLQCWEPLDFHHETAFATYPTTQFDIRVSSFPSWFVADVLDREGSPDSAEITSLMARQHLPRWQWNWYELTVWVMLRCL